MIVVALAVSVIVPLTMVYMHVPWYAKEVPGKGMDNIDAFQLAFLIVEAWVWLLGLIPCFLYARTLRKEKEGS